MNNKLAVIYGGPSPEHDISILTGLQAAKILSSKYEVLNIYWSRDNKWFLVDNDLESKDFICLLYTSPSPRDTAISRMPSSA